MFEFDGLCSVVDCLVTFASTSESNSPPASLELKLLLVSLNYSFLGPGESLPVIISSDLDRDQEEK